MSMTMWNRHKEFQKTSKRSNTGQPSDRSQAVDQKRQNLGGLRDLDKY